MHGETHRDDEKRIEGVDFEHCRVPPQAMTEGEARRGDEGDGEPHPQAAHEDVTTVHRQGSEEAGEYREGVVEV